MSAGQVFAAQQTHQLARADGTVIHYTLDAPAVESAGLIVLAQGSGCLPAAHSVNLATVRAAFPAYTGLIVEKSGIAPDSAIENGQTDCPKAFLDTYTLSQRVDDYARVLTHLKSVTATFDTVILFGGSEGGLAMEALAARIHPTAAILLSGSVGGTFGEMVLSEVPPEGQPSVSAGFAQARVTPDNTLLGGHTYRFWADSLDHRSSDYLEATDTPFLLIYGGRDTAAVQPVRTLADRFAQQGRCNLTYWEFPALNHGMADPTGLSRMPEIARLAASWAEHPMKSC
ncbi:hypothetical protein VW29_12250 [Devosia limi DSM 17137]|uniref:Uncharacterized protein n=1 Tax=Devosia limi DSM 17137 TaxID=1121477 RepID=A0A0F5LP26_9HYPH|nr:hypothetical protein VW29_12250 [Devosia limi DSM 17137]